MHFSAGFILSLACIHKVCEQIADYILLTKLGDFAGYWWKVLRDILE